MRPLLERAERLALERSPLGANLRPDELALVEDFAPGRVVLAEGQPPRGVHVVLAGRVEVTVVRRDEGVSATLPLGEIGAAGVFGEYSAWDRSPVSATVTTVEPTRVALLVAEDFLRLVVENDRLGQVLLGNLSLVLIERLRDKITRATPLLLIDDV